MASLAEKVDLLIGANLHALVDAALRARSVAVLNEQIRRAEESLDELGDTITIIVSDRRIEAGKNDNLRGDIELLKADAMVLLQSGQKSRAATLVAQRLTKEGSLEKSDKSLAGMDKELEQLRAAEAALTTKLEDLKATRDNVERALVVAKRTNKTVDTIEDVTRVLEDDGADGVAAWAEKLSTQAEVRLERTLEKHQRLLDPESDDRVAAELARMEQQLAGQTDDTTGEAAAAAAGTTFKVTVEPD